MPLRNSGVRRAFHYILIEIYFLVHIFSADGSKRRYVIKTIMYCMALSEGMLCEEKKDWK
jgi:hypothetical protein